MNTLNVFNPMARRPAARPLARRVAGVDEITGAAELPGGSLLDIVTNRFLYDLRWNPILKQWVPKEYETAAQIPGTVTVGGKQVPWALIIGGVAVAGLAIWIITKRK